MHNPTGTEGVVHGQTHSCSGAESIPGDGREGEVRGPWLPWSNLAVAVDYSRKSLESWSNKIYQFTVRCTCLTLAISGDTQNQPVYYLDFPHTL